MPLARNLEPDTRRGLKFEREARFAVTRRSSQNLTARPLYTHGAAPRVAQNVRIATFATPRATMPWLAGAFATVDEIELEAEEEGYPPIGDLAKRNAKRVLFMAGRSSLEPAVYASMDGEIAIYFKARSAASALLILLDNEGGAGCYWSVDGKSDRERHNDVSQLPEDFVQAHLRALGGLTLSQSLV